MSAQIPNLYIGQGVGWSIMTHGISPAHVTPRGRARSDAIAGRISTSISRLPVHHKASIHARGLARPSVVTRSLPGFLERSVGYRVNMSIKYVIGSSHHVKKFIFRVSATCENMHILIRVKYFSLYLH